MTLPPWTPRCPARHFLPAFAALTPIDWSFRFELSVERAGVWSPWIAAAAVGPHRFGDDVITAHDLLAPDVDVFVAPVPVDRVRLRVRLRAEHLGALLEAPWLVTLSASALDDGEHGREAAPSGPARLAVPALSQMAEAQAIRMRICSPTSVAMVLVGLGHEAPVATLAAEVYHPALDLYGVWPAAIRAAARRGILGYLLRFPDWAAAVWCLTAGLPIVASISYAAGELTGAPMPETTGHLVVLTGFDGDEVLVNDPAAPTRDAVPRRYRLDELRRAWLERAGVGYVFFTPPAATGRVTR